jgi:hypothetical protein
MAVIREVTGVTPELSCTGGTSDGRFIADICNEVVELGPVNATIHKLNECVRVADLEPLSAIYRGMLERADMSAAGPSKARMGPLRGQRSGDSHKRGGTNDVNPGQRAGIVRDWLRFAVSRFSAK